MTQQSSWLALIRLHAHMQSIVRAVYICNEPREHRNSEKSNGVLGRDDWAAISARVINNLPDALALKFNVTWLVVS